MPSENDHFDGSCPLPGGWRVAAFEPGRRLSLARSGKAQLRELGQKGFVSAAALTIAVALLAATHQDRGFRLVLAPVLLMLGVVVAFGVLAVVRGARRATADSQLTVELGAGTLTGCLEGGGGAAVVSPVAEVSALRLEVRRGAGANARAPKSWATVRVLLHDGRALDGPEAWGPDDAWEQTEALVLPVARALARLTGAPLQRHHAWDGSEQQERP